MNNSEHTNIDKERFSPEKFRTTVDQGRMRLHSPDPPAGGVTKDPKAGTI